MSAPTNQNGYEELTILCAAGEHAVLRDLSTALLSTDVRMITASKGQHVLNCLEREPVSVLILDHVLGDMEGIELLGHVRREFPDVVTVFGAPSERSTVVSAAHQEGASEVVIHPYTPDKVKAIIERAVEQRQLIEQNRELQAQLDDRFGLRNIIGNSLAMQNVFQQIHQFANARSNILITGESGTGKELVARAIHRLSKRYGKPFVAVNCGSIPEELAESELFGHERGAFTNAYQKRTGKFELSNGGTLFLDEVGELPLMVQVKLLRVLEEQVFERVGGTQSIRVDVRLIAATNAPLSEMVQQGRFREDLYYRLKVLGIHLPLLRERREDIPLLVRHFLSEAAKTNDREVPVMTSEAFQCLYAYDWPGNVRELRNLIEGLVVMANQSNVIDRADLPEYIRNASGGSGDLHVRVGMTLAEVERELILSTLRDVEGNRRKAAKILNIGLRTLFRKINKYRADGHDVP